MGDLIVLQRESRDDRLMQHPGLQANCCCECLGRKVDASSKGTDYRADVVQIRETKQRAAAFCRGPCSGFLTDDEHCSW